MRAAGFEWDEGNRVKCQKHGMTTGEIEEVFTGLLQVAPDLKHSETEARQLAMGRTAAGRAAFVVFTMRGDRIRPLSARFMHQQEVDRYDPQGS